LTTADFERASAFEEALREACADRKVSTRLGTAFFTDRVPRVWSMNQLRVEVSSTTAEEVAVEAERVQGTACLVHRRVAVLDQDLGRCLEPGFAGLGWKTDAFVFMAHRRASTRPVDTTEVVEVDGDVLTPFRHAITRETIPDVDEETVLQIARANEVVAEAANARHFAVLVDGAPVSSADLYSDGRTAQIEDVATVPDARGRGYASAVVMRALEEARHGHDFVFLVADSRDWPKELYRRLGFEPLGEKFAYTLDLSKRS
jgi:ribosomal protein S18 acetylase RimI-like enzyme